MMVGAIVGVGVFGLPFVFQQAGFSVALLQLLLMAVFLTVLQLMQAEVALQTKGRHRLVGYIREYLGERCSLIAVVALSGALWGAMIAYMIVGGNFLFLLASPIFGGTEFLYSFILVGVVGILLYRGASFVSRFEVFVVGALLFLFLFVVLACIPHIHPQVYLHVSSKNAFLPYGIILFSLAGVGIVPEMMDLLGKQSRAQIGKAIMWAMGLILLLYILFTAAVVGVTGAATTQVAFDGLVPVLGDTFRVVTSLLGIITILSIYVVLGMELINMFRLDFKMNHKQSWLLVMAVPIILFLIGAREFIQVIGFVGSVFAGSLSILVCLMYLKLKRSPWCKQHHCLNFPDALTWLLIALFVAGIIFAIVTTFFS